MRILVDACVGRYVVESLTTAGFSVEWVAEWGTDPGDREILARAHQNGQVLLTRDKDFGELIFRDNQPHSGVIRLSGTLSYRDQADLAQRALTQQAPALLNGQVVTIEPGRTRVSRSGAEH